jgi:hypothetical protein
MRYDPEAAADDWEMLEIVVRGRRPCSDEYAEAKDDDLVKIFRELRLVRATGMPPDRHRGNPDVQKWSGRCRGSHKQVVFYVLKAKPSGWRLYFFVPEAPRRRMIFLYAVNKKRDERNQEDFQRLCRYRSDVESRRDDISLEPIEIPDR